MKNSNVMIRNTSFLYARQIILLLLSFFTAGITLRALGQEDYGIYNVVGGLVVTFSFLNESMTSAIQRYINVAIGKNDNNCVNKTFNNGLLIQVGISVIVVLLAETIGLWYVYNHLNIPDERFDATLWCYQFSVISVVLQVLRIPFQSIVLAYEKMDFFAVVTVIEAAAKLTIVLVLPNLNFDKLIFYSAFQVGVVLIVNCAYVIFCKLKISNSKMTFHPEKALLKEMTGFSGWSIFGAIANTCSSQGISLVTNSFLGVLANAAIGIANQVTNAVWTFVSNFQTAFKPQIIQSYAEGNTSKFKKLIVSTSKISFFLMGFIAVPLFFNLDFVLTKWLGDVPGYSAEIISFILIEYLFNALSGPLWMSVQAVGDIKKYQIIVSVFIFSTLPLSYVALKIGAPVYSIYIIKAILAIIIFLWRVFFLQGRIDIKAVTFICDVIPRCLLVIGVSSLIVGLVGTLCEDWVRFFVTCIVSVIVSIIATYFIGLNKEERTYFLEFVKRRRGK